jgi:exonuclease SbcC
MRNFMPYRDAILDFAGIHLAVITGDNGNGKSAIIDAITWALWGKARAASDDDLIHSAQMEMEVEFEFRIGDQLYRIVRKRTRPKKKTSSGQSALEFQMQNNEGFRAITGLLGKRSRENYRMVTPSATIGVLDTISAMCRPRANAAPTWRLRLN